MLTHPLALALWRKFAAAPSPWFTTPEARNLIAQSLLMVRRRAGRAEARILRDLIYAAAVS